MSRKSSQFNPQVNVLAKRLLAFLRLPASFRVRAINDFLELCAWLRANPPSFRARDRAEFPKLVCKLVNAEPIDFLEFGVYEGDSILKWAQLHRHPQSRFIGFDSFEGLPEDWKMATYTIKKSVFSTNGQTPQTDDPRVSFEKGWFQDSLPIFMQKFEPRARLVIHIDADLYSSCLFALATLNPWIKPGTIILFDEFSSAPNEFRALLDYQRAFMRKVKSLGSTRDFHAQFAIEVIH